MLLYSTKRRLALDDLTRGHTGFPSSSAPCSRLVPHLKNKDLNSSVHVKHLETPAKNADSLFQSPRGSEVSGLKRGRAKNLHLESIPVVFLVENAGGAGPTGEKYFTRGSHARPQEHRGQGRLHGRGGCSGGN